MNCSKCSEYVSLVTGICTGCGEDYNDQDKIKFSHDSSICNKCSGYISMVTLCCTTCNED